MKSKLKQNVCMQLNVECQSCMQCMDEWNVPGEVLSAGGNTWQVEAARDS